MIWGLILAAASTYLSHKAQKKQAQKAKDQAKKDRAAALGQLSPENIQALTSQLYGGNMAQMAPSMMSGQQRLKSSLAKRGLTGSGLGEQLSAGLPGQYSQAALGSARNEAMGLASQRAGVIGNMPITPSGPSGYQMGADLLSIGAGYDYLKRQGGEDPWGAFKKKKPTGPTTAGKVTM